MDGNQESVKNSRSLTILFFPFAGAGPTNQCIGMGDELRRRGHRVIIITDSTWKDKIAALDLEVYIVDLNEMPQELK